MIRDCAAADIDVIESIINEAALAYRGVIPADCWHEPYMSRVELAAEIAAGVRFSAWEEEGRVAGVMGLQRVKDATLIRHAYVRTSQQGSGIGGRLIASLHAKASGPMLVGTWADARWAIHFYERHGFRLVSPEEKDRLLDTYWRISPRQREVSVVLQRS